jgi:hypothetical protein
MDPDDDLINSKLAPHLPPSLREKYSAHLSPETIEWVVIGLAHTLAARDFTYALRTYCSTLARLGTTALPFDLRTALVNVLVEVVCAEGLEDTVREWIAKLALSVGSCSWVHRATFLSERARLGIRPGEMPPAAGAAGAATTGAFSPQESLVAGLSDAARRASLVRLSAMWRPLHATFHRLFPHLHKGSVDIHTAGLAKALFGLLHGLSEYYVGHEEAIFELVAPRLCPLDIQVYSAQAFLCATLPSTGEVSAWLPEALAMWRWTDRCKDWNIHFASLVGRVAFRNIGRVDWAPHAPGIFSLILQLLHVPVGTGGNIPWTLSDTIPEFEVFFDARTDPLQSMYMNLAKICVAMIVPGGPGLAHLRELLGSVEPYYHPSNNGEWSTGLAQFLVSLCDFFSMRYNFERTHPRKDNVQTPEHARLTDAEVLAFVEVVTPLVLQAQQGKTQALTTAASHTIKTLAMILPGKTGFISAALETVEGALLTLTESHRTTAALKTLGQLARMLFLRPDITQILPVLLNLTLPGIDPNDNNKCHYTLEWYFSVVHNVPVIGLPAEGDHPAPLAGELHGWAIDALDQFLRILALREAREDRFDDASSDLMAMLFFETLFVNATSPLFASLLDRVVRTINTETLLGAFKPVSTLCGYLVGARPERALAVLIPVLTADLLQLGGGGGGGGGGVGVDPSPRAEWLMRLLAGAVSRGGAHLLKHRDVLWAVARFVASIDGEEERAKRLRKAGRKFLTKLLRAFTTHYVTDCGPLNAAQRAAGVGSRLEDWAPLPHIDEVVVDWHVPSLPELEAAFSLYDELFSAVERDLDAALARAAAATTVASAAGAGSRSAAPRSVTSVLQVLRGLLRGAAAMLADAPPPEGEYRHCAAHWRPGLLRIKFAETPSVFPACRGTAFDDTGARRERAGALVHRALEGLRAAGDKDTTGLVLVAKLIDVLVNTRGVTARAHAQQTEFETSPTYFVYDPLPGVDRHPRYRVVQGAAVQVMFGQLIAALDAPLTRQAETLIGDLYELSIHGFSKVRKVAQGVLTAALEKNVTLISRYMSAAISNVARSSADTQADAARVTGSVYVLSIKPISNRFHRRWAPMHEFLKALCAREVVHARESVSSRVTQLFGYVQHMTALPLSLGAVDPGALTRHPGIRASVGPGADDLVDLDEARRLCAETEREWDEHYRALVKIVADECCAGEEQRWLRTALVVTVGSLLIRSDRLPSPDFVRGHLLLAKSPISTVRQEACDNLDAIIKLLRPRRRDRVLPEDHADDMAVPTSPEPGSFFAALRGAAAAAAGRRRTTASSAAHFRELTARAAPTAVTSPALNVPYDYPYQDKNYYGWYTLPREATVYAPGPPEPVPGADEQVAILREAFLSPEYVEAFLRTMLSEDPSSYTFDDSRRHLIKTVFQVCGPEAMDLWLPRLAALAESHGHLDEQCVAAEGLSALVRASKHWDVKDIAAMWRAVLPIYERASTRASQAAGAFWSYFVRSCVYDRDLARIAPLAESLLAFEAGQGSSLVQTRRIANVTQMLNECSWRGAGLCKEFLVKFAGDVYIESAPCKEDSGHDISVEADGLGDGDVEVDHGEEGGGGEEGYSDEEEEEDGGEGGSAEPLSALGSLVVGSAPPTLRRGASSGRLLSGNASAMGSPSMRVSAALAPPGTAGRLLHRPAEEYLSVRNVLAGCVADIFRVLDPFGREPVPQCLTDYAASLTRKLQEGVTKKEENPKEWNNLCEYFLMVIFNAHHSKTLGALERYMVEWLPFTCMMFDGPETVKELARYGVISWGHTLVSASTAAGLLGATAQLIRGAASWRAREASLYFLQAFAFSNRFILGPAGFARARDLAIEALCDTQIEVREVAKDTLAGLLRISDPAELPGPALPSSLALLGDKLGRAREPRKRALGADDPTARVREHGGVLGLCALVASQPTAVPGWLPEVLMHLAAIHRDSKDPVKASIKAVLQEFYHSHQDFWERDKAKFSPEQLEVIVGLVRGGSYYA